MPKYQQIQTVFLVITLLLAGLCMLLATVDGYRRWDIAKVNCISSGSDWVELEGGKSAKCVNTHNYKQ
jgi:hypothetical protein